MQIHHHEVFERKILIVDDDPDFQLLLQNCLKKEGYCCAGAVSAEEALERFRESPPDLVILDLGLSKASGIAFLQNFTKTIVAGKKIPPVLVVSGYSDPEIVNFVASLGAARFISKPVGCLEIVLAIRSFFGNISQLLMTKNFKWLVAMHLLKRKY